jgi:5-methylcytosine-specific restriction endonuclease McrA
MHGLCAICGREETLTRHHLIPRTRHPNKKNKRDFDRAKVRETVGICRPCHSQIHRWLTEKELEREWNTVEKLRTHPELRKFVQWIADKPPGFRCRTYAGER